MHQRGAGREQDMNEDLKIVCIIVLVVMAMLVMGTCFVTTDPLNMGITDAEVAELQRVADANFANLTRGL